MATNKHFELLVIGAGVFGTSTVYHLSKSHTNPSSVAIIDRTPFPPRHAASTDINKIVRMDYTSSFYMRLAFEAMEAWTSWPELKDKFHRTGWVSINETGSDIPQRVKANFQELNHDPTSYMSLQEVRDGFGGILKDTQLEEFTDGYWNPEAGWCDAGAAVAAMLASSTQKGIQYIVGDVQSLLIDQSGAHGVKLLDGNSITADRIILATGAWTSSLLSPVEDQLNMAESERIEQQIRAAGVCVAHVQLSSTEAEKLNKHMPIVIYGTRCDVQPPPENRLLKFTNGKSFVHTVTTPSGRRISVPPEQDQGHVPTKLQEETRRTTIEKVMPEYAGRPIAYWRLCWDAISPTQDHLITQHPHPSLKSVYLAVGGSFHSYKFLPIVGRYVVNVLNGQSNGEEKDAHWEWKKAGSTERGAHEKTYPKRDLVDLV